VKGKTPSPPHSLPTDMTEHNHYGCRVEDTLCVSIAPDIAAVHCFWNITRHRQAPTELLPISHQGSLMQGQELIIRWKSKESSIT
jgi:hypothetical protein